MQPFERLLLKVKKKAEKVWKWGYDANRLTNPFLILLQYNISRLKSTDSTFVWSLICPHSPQMQTCISKLEMTYRISQLVMLLNPRKWYIRMEFFPGPMLNKLSYFYRPFSFFFFFQNVYLQAFPILKYNLL